MHERYHGRGYAVFFAGALLVPIFFAVFFAVFFAAAFFDAAAFLAGAFLAAVFFAGAFGARFLTLACATVRSPTRRAFSALAAACFRAFFNRRSSCETSRRNAAICW